MKYDDASWHYEGNFQNDLSNAAGGTHIGMFLVWCLLNGLGSDFHKESDIDFLKERRKTPAEYFLDACDEKLTDEDLNEDGNAFAKIYYEGAIEGFAYMHDYEDTLDPDEDLESMYCVGDTWETYDLIAPVITFAFEKWQSVTK